MPISAVPFSYREFVGFQNFIGFQNFSL